MKRIRITSAIVFVLLWTNVCSLTAQTKKFVLEPERPQEKSEVRMTYDARSTTLKEVDSLKGLFTGYQAHRWVQGEIPFSFSDSVWVADYKLPEGLALLNMRFAANGLLDNGGKDTYTYIFSDNNGQQMSGGLASWGILRNPAAIKGTPFVVDTNAFIVDEVTLYWIKQELMFHPENRIKMLYPAMSLLKRRSTQEADQLMENELQTVQQLPDLSEDDWISIRNVYVDLIQDSAKTASITDTIVSRFPTGTFVSDRQRLEDYHQISIQNTNEDRLTHIVAFLERHPLKESQQEFNAAHRIDYTGLYWQLAVLSSISDDIETFTTYISNAPYNSFGQIIYRALEIPYVSQNTVTAREILPYARVVMDRVDYFKNNFEGDQYAEAYYYGAPLFATILVENGFFEEAYPYASAAQSVQNYKQANLNETYVRVLEGLHKDKELLIALETAYRLNQSSTYMLDLMKTIYLEKHGGKDDGYKEYLSALRDPNRSNELKSKIQKMLINEEITDFELYDQYGNLVHLSAQKGKIIVLDFWASWCAPCKAAFPGMKLAQAHFNTDPNVLFYFVNTQERKSDMKDYVTRYMSENDFPFTVLLDEDSKVSKALGVGPIPHKMVIDINNRLRFSEVGYMGSPSELAEEVVEMVNILKSEQ